jgi:hypothetical protein
VTHPSGGRAGAAGAVIPIVILNWNGEEDTLACLRSIRASEPAGVVPVVVDNGSAPASLERLQGECGRLFDRVLTLDRSELQPPSAARRASFSAALEEGALVLIRNGENVGFAGGNNVGLRFAELAGAEWVMLLNNDTEIAPDAFRELRTFVEREPAFAAVTAQIRHFGERTRIQNCGGDLTYLGSRRYRFADRDAAELPRTPHSVVTFATGCALLFRFGVTGALSEDFFFGEEDYEFALRMRARGLAMACVHGAVVYHKGGTTIRRSSSPVGAILVHYAARLVNVRNYYSPVRWQATRMAAYAYLPLVLARHGIAPWKAAGMIRRIEAHLRAHRRMGRAEFQAMAACT